MGFSISWFAVRGKSASEVLSQLGLVETSRREWLPESSVLSSDLPSGWFLVFFNEASPHALKPESLRALSTGSELIACQVEEHVMVSTAAEWREGKELWFVVHDTEDDPRDVEFTGAPPNELAEIRERQKARYQVTSNVDYAFEIPIELAARITGFRHDEAFDEAASEPFVVLERKG